MAKSIKLKGNNYIDSSSVATIINDNEIYETGEVLNGKRVYAKRLVSNESINYNNNYVISIPHGISLDLVDLMWIDVSNSYLYSKFEDNSYFRIIPIISTAYITNSTDETSATIELNNVLVIGNSGWGEGWTKVVTIKFTYK